MTLVYNKFNRGEIDDLLFARDDVQRVNNSAKRMENFLPSRMGPMIFRPGMEYVGELGTSDVRLVPFFSSLESTALLEFRAFKLRIWDNNNVITTTSVSSNVADSSFPLTSPSAWVSDNDSGATTELGDGALLTGTGTGEARLYQTINVQINAEHTLKVVVEDAPVTLLIGTSGASSDNIFSGTLGVGTHSLVFTPNANVTLTFKNSLKYATRIKSAQFSGNGVLELPTDISASQLNTIRHTQSADVIFIAYDNGVQYRIERRGVKSWSIIEYRANDGPFGFINNSDITLRSNRLSGDAQLFSNLSYFTPSSVGTLYKLISSGQRVEETVSAADSGTNAIRVTGVGADRGFNINVTIAGSGTTVTLQRSTDEVTWSNVESYAVNTFKSFNDELDNSILFYRLYVGAGDYGSGSAILKLIYSGGSIEGVARVTGYVNTTQVNIQIYQDFGNTESTRDWYEGQWTQTKGYPTSVALYEGRLWWAGKTRLWGSVSDSFSSFDDLLEGANAPIQRTIGFGPVDTVHWLAISSRLLMGLASDEISVRSSSFGEILDATNTNLKSGSSQGVAPIDPVRIDEDVLFVQRATRKIYQLTYSGSNDSHRAVDLMTLNESIAEIGIKRMAVSRQPETRVWCVLNDGNGLVFNFDAAEDVKAWSRFTTDGELKDVVVLPSEDEDRVYYAVKRGNFTRLEQLGQIRQAKDYPLDSFKSYILPGSTITDIPHLNNKVVNVWADGSKVAQTIVTNGTLTLPRADYYSVVVGIEYEAVYISNKLSGFAQYSVLNRLKRISAVGMIARDIYKDDFRIGPDFDNMQRLPTQENGTSSDHEQIVDEYDEPKFYFSGRFDVDSRVHITCKGPCKIMALVYDVEQSENLAKN